MSVMNVKVLIAGNMTPGILKRLVSDVFDVVSVV